MDWSRGRPRGKPIGRLLGRPLGCHLVPSVAEHDSIQWLHDVGSEQPMKQQDDIALLPLPLVSYTCPDDALLCELFESCIKRGVLLQGLAVVLSVGFTEKMQCECDLSTASIQAS